MHRTTTALLIFALTAASAPVFARSRGIAAENCGCHNGGSDFSLSLLANPSGFAPGADVEFSLSLNGAAVEGGGVFVTTNGIGTFEALPGEGMGALSDGLTHTSPKAASGGQATFRFAWTAPSTPGAVRFVVAAVGADMNSRTAGDLGKTEPFDFVFGCEPQEFYYDGDGDGYGRDDFTPMLGCQGQPPATYAANHGDCEDYDAETYPGAPEVCDGEDDDCDGEIDEGAVPVELWPDEDGDGYFAEKTGEPLMGCVGIEGYAALGGDCAPDDPEQSPAADESCNFYDDNCNGDVDERVRPTCGEGWCRREAVTCKIEDCTPGAPSPEICNLIDDDCDGAIDNEATCEGDTECVMGECVAFGTTPPAGTGGTASGSSGAGGTGGTSDQPPRVSERPSGCSVAVPRGRGEIVGGLALGIALLGAVRRSRSRKY
jgi:hypothetical protein